MIGLLVLRFGLGSGELERELAGVEEVGDHPVWIAGAALFPELKDGDGGVGHDGEFAAEDAQRVKHFRDVFCAQEEELLGLAVGQQFVVGDGAGRIFSEDQRVAGPVIERDALRREAEGTNHHASDVFFAET